MWVYSVNSRNLKWFIYLYFCYFFFSLLFSIGKWLTFAKICVEGAAAHPAPAPRFLRAGVNISNLTCQDCLLINWLLVKRKDIWEILTPVSFVGRDVKCSCFIYSNMFQQQFYKEMKVVFFSLSSSTPVFLSRPVSHINNSSNNCQPYNICYRKAYVTAGAFKSLI